MGSRIKGGETVRKRTQWRKVDDMERLKQELVEEGAHKSNLLEILPYCRPDIALIVTGMISLLLHGTIFPILAVCYGQAINVCSQL